MHSQQRITGTGGWKRFSAYLLSLALLLCAVVALGAPISAHADDAGDMEAVTLEMIPVSITSSTDGLPEGQVQITATSENKSDIGLTGHQVSFEIPSGWKLVSGSTKSEAKKTADGDSVSTAAVIEKDDSSKGSETETDDGTKADAAKNTGKKGAMPRTGDFPKIAVAALLLVAALMFIWAARKLRFKGTMVIVLAALMVTMTLPVQAIQAFADEAGVSESADREEDATEDISEGSGDANSSANMETATASTTLKTTANGEKLSIKTTASCLIDGNHDTAGVISVDVSDSVAKGTTSATLILETTEQFSKLSDADLDEAGKDSAIADPDNEAVSGKFDSSLLSFSGALAGATVRGTSYYVKTTSNDTYAQNSIEGDDKTHYELYITLDDISVPDTDDDSIEYGYITFAAGSFKKSDNADKNTTGMACVSFMDIDTTILPLTSTEKIGNDTKSHVFENGKYWDGNNKFRIPVDYDGYYIGMPVRDDSPYYSLVGNTYEYTIDGDNAHKYRMVFEDDVCNNVAVLGEDGTADATIKATEADLLDDNLWLTLEVEGKTGDEAYTYFTEKLGNGLKIGGAITSNAKDIVAYPQGTSSDSNAEGESGFVYSESNPVALVWASDISTGDTNTTITYRASVMATSDLTGSEKLAKVNLEEGTTFAVEKPEVQSSSLLSSSDLGSDKKPSLSLGNTDNGSDVVDKITTPKVESADANVATFSVTVSNEEFEQTMTTAGAEKDEQKLDAAFSYVSGIDLTMTSGSTNAFGVAEEGTAVQVLDGASFYAGLTESTDGSSADGKTKLAAIDTSKRTINNIKNMSSAISDETKELVNDDTIKAAKTAFEDGKAIVKAISEAIKAYIKNGKPSDLLQLTSVIGLVGTLLDHLVPTANEKVYTTNELMEKLNVIESKIDKVTTNQEIMAMSMREIDSSLSYSFISTQVNLLQNYLGGSSITTMLSNLQKRLKNYNELDSEGNPTDVACSLSTPIESMPEDAIKLVRLFVSEANNKAVTSGAGANAQAAMNTLYAMVCPGNTGDKGMIEKYFDYVETLFNWQSETYPVKQLFLARATQMWLNGSTIVNAELALKAYDNERATGKTDDEIGNTRDNIAADQNAFVKQTENFTNLCCGKYDMDALAAKYPAKNEDSLFDAETAMKDYGVDTVSDLMDIFHKENDVTSRALSTDDGKTDELLVTTDGTTGYPKYETSTFSRIAAYDSSCFAQAYTCNEKGGNEKGVDFNSTTVLSSANGSKWQAGSSLTESQVRVMISRLKNMPSIFIPQIETTDDEGKAVTCAVQNIDEEMQWVGFKTINTAPSTNYKYTFTDRDSWWTGNGNDSGTAAYNLVDQHKAGLVDVANPYVKLDDNAIENQTWSYVLANTGFRYTYPFKNDSKYRETSSSGIPTWYTQAMKMSYWLELGSSKDQRLLPGDIGTRIQNSSDWVVLSNSDEVKAFAGRDHDANYHSACRYGTVFNYKTGEIKANQLLYVIDVEYYASIVRFWQDGWYVTRWWNAINSRQWVTRCEFYGFGVYKLGTSEEDAKIDTTGLYNRRNSHNTYMGLYEDTYWDVDSSGNATAVQNGVKKSGQKVDPKLTYKR